MTISERIFAAVAKREANFRARGREDSIADLKTPEIVIGEIMQTMNDYVIEDEMIPTIMELD